MLCERGHAAGRLHAAAHPGQPRLPRPSGAAGHGESGTDDDRERCRPKHPGQEHEVSGAVCVSGCLKREYVGVVKCLVVFMKFEKVGVY